MNIPEVLLPFLCPPVLCLLHQTCVRLQISGNVRGTWAWRHAIKMQAAITASRFLPRNNFSPSDSLYDCFAMSLMVLDRECRSHQLEMSRNACIKLRSERDACPRDAARCGSRAIPEPPSRKLMTVSSCSMPSTGGSIAAPTRINSSLPSSFANVLQKLSPLSCAKCKAVTYTPFTPSIHNTVTQYQPTTSTNEDTAAEFLNDLWVRVPAFGTD